MEESHYKGICSLKEAAYRFVLDYVKGGQSLSDQIDQSEDPKSCVAEMLFDAELEDGKSREAFLYLYNFCEDLKLSIRRLILGLFISGFLCLALILLQNVWYVLTYT